MELRDRVAAAIYWGCDPSAELTSEEIADEILSIPEIREALSLKHNLETALKVNGEFHVTAENLKSSGNSWA